MNIWDRYPNYTDDELRLLVRAAASALYDSAEDRETLDPELFEMGPRSAARELARSLHAMDADLPRDQLEALLADEATARAASLAALEEIRKHPELAARVAETYEDQLNKMAGVEMLLAGALLVLAVRIKSLSLGDKVKVSFYESSDAVKDFIVRLVSPASAG